MRILAAWLVLALPIVMTAQQPQGRVLGVVSAVSPQGEVTLAADTGGVYAVKILETASIRRIEPGEKDLAKASQATLADVASGDRLLVRGEIMPAEKVVLASSIVVMKKESITSANSKREAEWKARSTAGVVKAVDPAAKQLRISARANGGIKEWTVAISEQTTFQRYADDSIRFQDAKPSALDAVQTGDQLRVLGVKQDSTIAAEQIVFGSFQTIGGEIVSLKPSGELILLDVQTRKKVSLRIPDEAKLRRMPTFSGGMRSGRPAGASGPALAGRPTTMGAAGPGNGGGPDLQQMMERLPAAKFEDLQTGDAVVASIAKPKDGNAANVIALIAGVDFLLRAPATQVSQVLGNWNVEIGVQ